MKWPAFIIVLAAVMTIAFVRTGLVGDCIGLFSFVWIGMLPFIDRKRVRARWANFSILFCGLLGVALATVSLLRHSGVLVVSNEASPIIARYRSVVGCVILGIILLLFVSGQLFGTKHEDKVEHDPAA
jgi:hypothetical protein